MNPKLNHRVSRWTYPLLLAVMAMLPCIPVRATAEEQSAPKVEVKQRPCVLQAASCVKATPEQRAAMEKHREEYLKKLSPEKRAEVEKRHAEWAKKVEARKKEMLKKYDKNKNGKLDPEEVKAKGMDEIEEYLKKLSPDQREAYWKRKARREAMTTRAKQTQQKRIPVKIGFIDVLEKDLERKRIPVKTGFIDVLEKDARDEEQIKKLVVEVDEPADEPEDSEDDDDSDD